MKNIRTIFEKIGKASLAACLLLLQVTACSKHEPAPVAPQIRPVYTFEVTQPTDTVQRGFSGSLRANEGLNYGFEVAGRIVDIQVKAGEFMIEGQFLAKLDTAEIENQLRNTEAQYKKSDSELKRTRLLNETGNASNANLEQAIANQLRAKTELETAKKRLRDTTLKMPYDGVIGSVLAEEQQIVNPGEGVFRIQSDGRLEMSVGIPAKWLNDIKINDQATVHMGSIQQSPGFSARVVEISRDMSRNTTYPVVMQLESEDNRLREGMDGEAFFNFTNPNGPVILVPLSCVTSTDQGEPIVYHVLNEQAPVIVKKSKIKKGLPRIDGMIEVTAGVNIGDILVSRGVNRVEEGMQVRVIPKE